MTSLSTRLRALPLLMAMAGGFVATGCAQDPTRESATAFLSQPAALVRLLLAIDR